MPAGAIEQQDGPRTWRDLGADLGQVRVQSPPCSPPA
jgi:hypothetical protein